MREFNAAHTWLDLRDVTEGTGKNMTYGDYEHLLGLCPPKPGNNELRDGDTLCEEHYTLSGTRIPWCTVITE